MKAAIYSRFSTDRQNESSIVDQERCCTEYAEREGMTIVAQYEDQGISGAALGNRPGALKLMEAAFARQFDVLIVTDLSRLSRSNGDLSKMIDRLTVRAIRVIGVQDGYDSERRGHKLQAGLAGIMGEAYREMIKERTHGALESRAKSHRSAGGKCYGYVSEPVNPEDPDSQRQYVIDGEQAAIIREIFARYVDGASCRKIARELNAKGITSPGSTWKRTVRRRRGWMGSGIRAIINNERFTGHIIWNRSTWIKDPDSGKRLRRERPRSEWHEYHDESLRIISDELFDQAQRRTKDRSNTNQRLKAGGKPRYLLSGLLKCGSCGANYILTSKATYECSGHHDGACSNSVRIRRDRVEEVILDPVRRELLSPERVERMAQEMQKLFTAHMKEQAEKADAVPAELQAISDRIGRLRERLANGDPDLEPDEIQAAIDLAEEKQKELVNAQPAAKQSAKMISMLPKAADIYRRQIDRGLDNDARAAGKARVILRKLLGNIQLTPEQGGLWAEFEVQPAALLKGVGTCGSGGRI